MLLEGNLSNSPGYFLIQSTRKVAIIYSRVEVESSFMPLTNAASIE